MLFSELYKIMVNKVTSLGFKGSDGPNRPPESAPSRNRVLICNFSLKLAALSGLKLQ